jgi:ureidoacrylate peracid hydrolase
MHVRRGRLHVFDAIAARKAALVVIDMQRTFIESGAPSEVAVARAIVPNINRLARALRQSGGVVVWVQATFSRDGPQAWPLFFDHMVNPALAARIHAGLTEGAPGHALWPELQVEATDLRVPKSRYSAFFPGTCDLAAILQARGIDTVLIVGTLTNVCCEASARDAMMAGFKTIMVSDGNAARSDAEHLATLVSVIQFVGDVYTTDEVIALLRENSAP